MGWLDYVLMRDSSETCRPGIISTAVRLSTFESSFEDCFVFDRQLPKMSNASKPTW